MIHQWQYHSNLYENWEITRLSDGYYTIKSLYNNNYIGISSTKTGEDNIKLFSSISPQTMWSILSDSSDRYYFVPYYSIDLMLVAPNSSVGAELQLTDTISSNNYEKWELIIQVQYSGTYWLQNIETERFASPYGPYLDDGTPINQWDFSTRESRKWLFERQSDYFYTIKNQDTQKYLGFKEYSDGTILIEQFSSIQDCTKWKMYVSTDKTLVFTPRGYEPFSYSLSVDPSYNNVGSALVLISYTDNTNYKDCWKLTEVRPYLGSISMTWHSDSSSIGYWDLSESNDTLNVYMYNIDSEDSSFSFISNTYNAMNQWSNALDITLARVSDTSNAEIKAYGGTREQIESQSGRNNTTWTGLSVYSTTAHGVMNLNDGNKLITIHEMNAATVYVIKRSDNDAVIKTCTHEFGHSLGYLGHAPNATDVMYSGAHSSYTLKAAESNHLRAIYLLY